MLRQDFDSACPKSLLFHHAHTFGITISFSLILSCLPLHQKGTTARVRLCSLIMTSILLLHLYTDKGIRWSDTMTILTCLLMGRCIQERLINWLGLLSILVRETSLWLPHRFLLPDRKLHNFYCSRKQHPIQVWHQSDNFHSRITKSTNQFNQGCLIPCGCR